MAATQTKRRTWETAFLLSASLDGGFKAAFEDAEATMKSLRQQYVEDSMTVAEKTEYYFDAAASAIMASGVYDVLGKIVSRYRECIEAAADFEYTMSGVEAVALADAESMAMLEAQAKELGATTKFTAVQAAEAMTYMAQAGWDTQDMLDGMPGVINLAAASGEDLAQSSSILADTLAGFQMEASESARVADVLAQAAAASNTSVIEMGDTFKTSAALAGALKYSIEDVSTAVGLMANVGIKGSRAGTTLRNILGGFLGGVTLKGTAIGEVEFTAVNEDGTVQAFAETIEYLRGLFSQMTEAEKIANAKSIAGERGYTGLIGILEATDEAYNEMYRSILNAEGAAQRMADIRLDNLTGDVTILKSAFEGLELTLGSQYQEDARGVVQFLTDAVNWANEFVEYNPKTVQAIGELTVMIGGAAGAITTTYAAISIIKAVGGIAAVIGGPATAIAAGIGAITAGIIMFAAQSREEYQSIVDAADEVIDAHRRLNEEYDLALEQIESEYDVYGNLIGQIAVLAEAENRSAAEKQLLSSLVDELNTKMPELGLVYDANTDSLNMSTEALQDYIENLYAAEQQQERIQRLHDLYAQNMDYAEQIKTLESEIELAKAEEEALLTKLKEEGLTFQNFGIGFEIADAEEKRKALEDKLAETRAAFASGSWEYTAVMNEANAAATPAVEAETVTNNSSGDTNIYFGSDSTMTADDYIRLLKEAGTEVTEEMIAVIEERFGAGGRMAY